MLTIHRVHHQHLNIDPIRENIQRKEKLIHRHVLHLNTSQTIFFFSVCSVVNDILLIYSFNNRTKQNDQSIDRKQGSTYLPEFPCVSIQKPAEYQRDLTHNDVPKIRFVVFNSFLLFCKS